MNFIAAASRQKFYANCMELKQPYIGLPMVSAGETIELILKEYETVEKAKGMSYKVNWPGNSVLAIQPKGTNMPLYADRLQLRTSRTPMSQPRYP